MFMMMMMMMKELTIMTTCICGRARQKPILRHISPNCKFVLALMHPTDEETACVGLHLPHFGVPLVPNSCTSFTEKPHIQPSG